ncbi:MAG TPA: autotransporter-associated beta strand repeat-containing protein, partial [Candidatus Acidoferrales bacterium]|nr:autotransporter-associated beta strand repeat-containing protein [Candidatus Acidoferrales bacterium]
GIAHFIPAASPVSSVPFTTSFNPGQGNFFNINGQQLMNGGWNNLGLQDVLPTWRWLVKSAGTKLIPGIDFADAYYGGASLLVAGTVTSATNDIWLYQTSLAVSNNTHVRFICKTGSVGATYLKLGLAFEDGPTNFQFLDIGNTVTTAWNTNTLDLSTFAGRKLSTISLRIGNATTVGSYSLRVGQLSVYNGSIGTPAAPASVAVDKLYNLDWKTYNLRLTWSNSADAVYCYNVYRRNPDNSLSWLWATPNNGVFISQLARSNNEAFTPVEVEAMGMDFGVSAHATYNFQWIDPVTIPLTNSDAAGVSSFNAGLNWSNSLAPAATNIYQVSGLDLRTPAVDSDQIFAGGALYLTNGGALRIKAAGSGNLTTIGAAPGTALFLGGGVVSDWSGLPETLAGYVFLTGTGNVFDPQANLFTVASQISGGGTLTVDAPGGTAGGALMLTGANTYTNGTVLNAADTLQLSGSGTLGAGAFLAISNTAAHGFGVVDLNGTSQNVGPLLGTGGIITNSSATAATLTIGAGNGGGTFLGRIVSGSAQPLTLNKAGSGAQTFSGSSAVASLNIALNNSSSPMTNGSLMLGAGASLNVGSGSGDSISIAAGNFGAASFGALDVSASSNFTVNVGTILVAVNAQNPGGNFPWTGTLNLGTNNTITASASITVGDSASAFNAASSQAVFTTAANGTTTILTPTLILGARKCNPTFTYGASSTFNVGVAGNRTALSIGNCAALGQLGTGTSFSSLNNFSPGIFNGVLSGLTIGTINNTGGGGQTGTMIIGTNAVNHLDISGAGNVVVLGKNSLGGGAGTATGILTVSNLDAGSVIASTDNSTAILLGATAQSAGTLNLNGGTLKVTTTGAAIAGGSGSSTLNLNGVKLVAGANSTSFITNLTTATVNSGGVAFDTANFNITVGQVLANGSGGLTKLGAGKLTLAKADTYAGNTMIGAGTVALQEPGNIASSAQIIVSNGAVLDVTGRTDRTLTLNNGKTLRGSGTVLGKLNAISGSTISPGDGIGTLIVQSNVTLAGTVVLELNRTNIQTSDKLAATNGTIAGGGILTVNNLGPALQAGDAFVLFNQAVGGFTTVNLPALGTGQAWMNNVSVDGSIRVAATDPPGLAFDIAPDQLTLSWPLDHLGWRLQVQTNDVLTGLNANWFDVPNTSGTNQLAVPVSPMNGSVFFRLIYP